MKMTVNNKGFTLIELIVAMSLFVLLIIIIGTSFSAILTRTSILHRSEESNIEGVIGLEMFRHDIQQTGLGLFNVPAPITNEAIATPASAYNDTGTHAPRPLVVGNDLSSTGIGTITDGSSTFNVLDGTDYVAIKATTVGTSKTAQKWSYLSFTNSGVVQKIWPSTAENFQTNDNIILLRRGFSNPPTASIERDTDGSYFFKHGSATFAHYSSQGSAVFTMYGLNNSSTSATIPFNRTDYFVARPQDATQVPPLCAPNTGILYKTTVNQDDRRLKYLPILDCVADMQVVLGWDTNNDGMVDTWSSGLTDSTNCNVSGLASMNEIVAAMSQANNDDNATTTLNIRNSLKVVKIIVLAQDGKKDTGYTTSLDYMFIGDVGERSLLNNAGKYQFTSSMRNYRWKEYRIIVNPKNLLSNQ